MLTIERPAFLLSCKQQTVAPYHLTQANKNCKVKLQGRLIIELALFRADFHFLLIFEK
jgi:hypothetical protein